MLFLGLLRCRGFHNQNTLTQSCGRIRARVWGEVRTPQGHRNYGTAHKYGGAHVLPERGSNLRYRSCTVQDHTPVWEFCLNASVHLPWSKLWQSANTFAKTTNGRVCFLESSCILFLLLNRKLGPIAGHEWHANHLLIKNLHETWRTTRCPRCRVPRGAYDPLAEEHWSLEIPSTRDGYCAAALRDSADDTRTEETSTANDIAEQYNAMCSPCGCWGKTDYLRERNRSLVALKSPPPPHFPLSNSLPPHPFLCLKPRPKRSQLKVWYYWNAKTF
jgi:hypothetical protein